MVASKQHLIPLISHPPAGFGISSKPHLCSSTLADQSRRTSFSNLPSIPHRHPQNPKVHPEGSSKHLLQAPEWARSLLPKRSSSKPRSSKWPCGCLGWQNGQGTQLLEISCSSLDGCSNLEGSNCSPLCFLTCPSYRVQHLATNSKRPRVAAMQQTVSAHGQNWSHLALHSLEKAPCPLASCSPRHIGAHVAIEMPICLGLSALLCSSMAKGISLRAGQLLSFSISIIKACGFGTRTLCPTVE